VGFVNNPYHHNSKKGIIWALFYENRYRVASLSTHQVAELYFLMRPNNAQPNLVLAGCLATMKEFERVSPDNETPSRWWFKEEVL
jgi:hypothetical protein